MTLGAALTRFWQWATRSAPVPAHLELDSAPSASFADLFGVTPTPSVASLLKQFRETVYACATINANAVASVPLCLYVRTGRGQRSPRCPTRKLARPVEKTVREQFKIPSTDGVDEVTDHVLLTMLSQVNPVLNGFELRVMTAQYLDIAGVAYWYLETNALGVPSAIWLLPPQAVRAKKNKTSGSRELVDSYEYTVGQKVQTIPAEQMIVFTIPALDDPYWSTWSPARAAYESIIVTGEADAFIQALLKNQARPDVVISPTEAIGPSEAERATRKFNRRFRLAGSGGVIVMESAVKLDQLTFTPRELDMATLSDNRRKRIANCFSVPWSMLDTADVNRANAEAGEYQHAKNAVEPRLIRYCEKLNQDLVPRYDPRLLIWFRPFIPGNIENEVKQRAVNQRTGVTTINEERDRDGLPPVPWGDEPWLPVSVAQVSVDRTPAAQPAAPAEPKGRAEPPVGEIGGPAGEDRTSAILDAYIAMADGVSRAEVVRTLQARGLSLDAARRATEPATLPVARCACGESRTRAPSPLWWRDKPNRPGGHRRRLPRGDALAKTLRGIFREQRSALMREIKAVYVESAKAGRIPQRWWTTPIDLGELGWNEEMGQRCMPHIQLAVAEGGKDCLTRLGVPNASDVFDVTNPRVRDAIQQHTFQFCEATNQTTSLQLNTAMAKLREELASGLLEAGDAMTELQRRVAGIFDSAEAYRSERIARTESSRALHEGQRIAARESGVVVGFQWLASGDACPECQTVADETSNGIPLDGAFKVGDDPSNPYNTVETPPLHPNCMCTMTEIIDPQLAGDLELPEVED